VIQTNKLQQEFIQRYGECDLETYFSPGRVNLIGEHIDYNGGFVLPATISLGISAVVKRREDAIIRIYANDFQEEIEFDLNTFTCHTESGEELHWSDYIKATVQVLKDNGVQLKGADILIGSDLPLGAGLSSSAALECLIAFIFNEDFYSKDKTQLL
jgi:galactokinase